MLHFFAQVVLGSLLHSDRCPSVRLSGREMWEKKERKAGVINFTLQGTDKKVFCCFLNDITLWNIAMENAPIGNR